MAMKIEIPEEYRGRFARGKVYTSRWIDSAVLVLNETDSKALESALSTIQGGISRFVRAGVIEIDFDSGTIEIPEEISERLQGENRTFERIEAGLLIR